MQTTQIVIFAVLAVMVVLTVVLSVTRSSIMTVSRTRLYREAHVTDKELILNAKTFLGLSTFEHRIQLDKINALSIAKTMGTSNKIGLFVGVILAVSAMGLFAIMWPVAIVLLLTGILAIVLAVALRPVLVSVGCGGWIENINFQRKARTMAKEIYAQLVAKLSAAAQQSAAPQPAVQPRFAAQQSAAPRTVAQPSPAAPQPPVVGVRRNPTQESDA